MRLLQYMLFLIPVLLEGSIRAKGTEVIKQFPLDERSIYKIGIGMEVPTTIMFPGTIGAISGANIGVGEEAAANVLFSYTENKHFFHVRALKNGAEAAANIVYKNKIYALTFHTCEHPARSVNFYEENCCLGNKTNCQVTPERLLELLDKTKTHHFFEMQYPEIVQQIEKAFPMSKTLYKNFEVLLEEVVRFDPEDTLVFRIKFMNKVDQDVYYQPQRLAVRVGDNIYYASIVDASGILPACAETYGYFAITGKPTGGRANLSVKNDFSIIVMQVEDSSLILIPQSC